MKTGSGNQGDGRVDYCRSGSRCRSRSSSSRMRASACRRAWRSDSEGGDVLSRCRAVPSELAALPANVQRQRRAVALQNTLFQHLDGDRLVLPFHQDVARQPFSVVVTGLVEPPVFGDAIGSQKRNSSPLLICTHKRTNILSTWDRSRRPAARPGAPSHCGRGLGASRQSPLSLSNGPAEWV